MTFLEKEEGKERAIDEGDLKMASKARQFKRDYDKGTVSFPDGTVVEVNNLPEVSKNFFCVYGFIRACQDPFGGIKNDDEKTEKVLEMARQLIDGTLTKESRSNAKSPEDKLLEMQLKLEEQKGFLAAYVESSDDEKRMLAKLGISRSGYEKEITRIDKAIVKFMKDNPEVS